MSQLTDDQRALFEGKNFAHLSALDADGYPRSSVVWVSLDGDDILVNTATGRLKERNMRRDPRVAISIHDQDDPYKMVSVRGRVVEMTSQGADDHIDALAKKYRDRDTFGDKVNRVLVRIRPEKVAGYGF